MSAYTILLTLIPLILFVVVDYYSDLKNGVYSSVLLAVLVGIFFYAYLDYFDYEIVLTVLFMIGFGVVSIQRNEPKWFRVQPVATTLALILLLAYMSFQDKSIVVKMVGKMVDKTKDMTPEMLSMVSNKEYLLAIEKGFCLSAGIHSIPLFYFAWYKSNKSWLIWKIVGYPFVLIGTLLFFYFSQVG